MNNSQKFDFMVVGQGLAGSALALQLLKRGKRILVVDTPDPNASSRVAAGLFNPVTGRYLVKTWMADDLFPYLHTFYREAEGLTNSKFFHPLPLYRPFGSIEEQNEWMGKSAEPTYRSYVENIQLKPTYPFVRDHFGGLLLHYGGYLDTIQYLDSVRKLIELKGLILAETFQDERLVVGEKSVRYCGFEADRIIFCQGMRTNKWFDWVPILPLKGETLRIQSDCEENIILNRGVYAVPVAGDGVWRVGATYSLTDKLPGITEEARAELTTKMNELTRFNYDIIDQKWGFRPTTHDRRPVLGRHPEHEVLYIFNGMGPKGVSLAPYFSQVLIQSIENHQSLNKDVDIKRYKLLYWSPST